MWEIATMIAVGAISGAMEGDSIVNESDLAAKDLELEGARVKRNAYKEAEDTYIAEQIAGGADSALEVANNISSGMSETSSSNQMLAANRQAAFRESQSLIEEGDRMDQLYRERAETTREVGKDRAKKAIVNKIVGGAVSGYGMSRE